MQTHIFFFFVGILNLYDVDLMKSLQPNDQDVVMTISNIDSAECALSSVPIQINAAVQNFPESEPFVRELF